MSGVWWHHLPALRVAGVGLGGEGDEPPGLRLGLGLVTEVRQVELRQGHVRWREGNCAHLQ